jgi:hypothetical protein
MAYQPIEPVGLGRNVSAEMMKGGPRLQEEIKTMGPNTIKMIALQQIADQQKQKAMQANLQAQPNPATIVQQLEQQLGGMGQPQQSMGLPPMRDKAQQVGGALAQKQQQQQQNMQRAAQGQGRPMMAGGGLLSRPAPNIDPRYFEGGGIVAFAQGKEVRGYFDGGAIAKKLGISLEELERRIADQESRGLPREKAEQAMEQAAAVPSARKDFSMTEAYRQKLGMPEKEEAKKELTGTTEFPESPMLGNVGGAPKGLAGLMPGANLPAGLPPVDDRTKKVFEGLPEEEVEVEETERVYAQLPAFEGAELPDSAKSTAPDKSKLAEGIASLRGADPTTQRDEASRYYKENMALDPEIQEEMDLMARRTREREEGYKPSRATTIREALAGAANRGSLGSVGAGISGAMSAREGDIQKRRDDLFKDRQNSLDKLVARSDSIASGALTYGQTEKESAKQDIRSALNAELGIFQSESADFRAAQQREAQVVLANASNEVRTDIANLTAKVQQQTNDALNSFRENSLTAEDTKSQRSLMGTLVTAKQRAEASIATAVAKLTSDLAFAAPPDDYEGTPEEYRKEVVSSAITGLAASLAPLDAMIAEFGENLGIDIPERAAPTEQKASPETQAFVSRSTNKVVE